MNRGIEAEKLFKTKKGSARQRILKRYVEDGERAQEQMDSIQGH